MFSIALALSAYQEGDGVVIVDAGGGTIDISAYARNPNVSTSFDEIAAPQCEWCCLIADDLIDHFRKVISMALFSSASMPASS